VIFAKLCCLFGKGAFRLPKGRYACFPFGFCDSERSRLAGKEVHHFRSSAREREGLRPAIPSLKDRDNHLALSDLRNFIAKISALLVT
jgi:hypothetical protein